MSKRTTIIAIAMLAIFITSIGAASAATVCVSKVDTIGIYDFSGKLKATAKCVGVVDVDSTGNYIYAVSKFRTSVYQITQKKPTYVVKRVNTIDYPAKFVFIRGNRLYVTGGKTLKLFDISKRDKPVEVGSTKLSGSAISVTYINGIYKLSLDNGKTYNVL